MGPGIKWKCGAPCSKLLRTSAESKIWHNQTYHQNRNRLRDIENRNMVAWCRGGVGGFSSVTQLCPTLCDPMNHSTPGLPVHHQLPESTQTHVHWVGDAIQQSHPLLSPSPPAFNLSHHQGLFKWVSSSHHVPKYWNLSFNIKTWLISFRMDWLDLFAVQGALKSLLKHHSSKASILWFSAFFTVQLSHPYMTTGKTIALTRQTFGVGGETINWEFGISGCKL